MLRKIKNKHRKGFTLIELSVVMVIIGIIISVVATVLPSLIVSSKISKARAILEKIDYAVQGYAIANNRLPFAAGATDGLESTGLFIGYLPYQSLGLSSGKDPWGNDIKYAVYGVSGGAANLTATFTDATAFCTALTQASTAAFDNSIAHTTTSATCGAADGTNSNNQAYIIVSGGPKDRDNANGFWDACNGDAGATFNAPNKIMDSSYDDLVRAFSINELIQRICSGSGGGSSGGTAGENTYTNGCTNGVDDDGDGASDCDDSDCAGDPACATAGGVTITTTTLSPDFGLLNSAYSATVNATGGTTPYEWTLTNNGGFSGLSINTYTGQLSGTLDQCPGTYNIIVDVEDATSAGDGGPYTDSETLALQVTGNMSISRTSGTGSTVTWSTTLQQETFQATGTWLGSLDWSLNAGGASGFSISSLGSDQAVLAKNGATTAGTYNFTITATDSSCSGNTAGTSLAVTVLSTATGTPGGISRVIDTQTYTYPTEAYTPTLLSADGDIYTVTHQTAYDNGYLRTTQISTDGTISTSEVDGTFFNYANGSPSTHPSLQVHDPDAIQVSSTISAAAFSSSASGQGYLHTLSVSASGQVGSGYTQSLVFETGQAVQPDIVHVTGDIYAIVYTGPDNDGWIKTVTIDGSTGAMALTGNSLEFDASNAYEANIVQVSGDLFAVAYSSNDSTGGGTGLIKSLSIDDTGAITELGSLSGGFDTICDDLALVPVDTDTLAVIYSGADDDGFIKTISIDAAGSLSLTGSLLEFDASNSYEPDMVHMGADIYAIAYADPRGNGRRFGQLLTVSIDTDGAIGSSVIDSLRFEGTDCHEPSIVQVDGDTAAIFYRGPNNLGTLVTIGFQ